MPGPRSTLGVVLTLALLAQARTASAARVGLVVESAAGGPGADQIVQAVAVALEASGDVVERAPFERAASRRREGAVERTRLEALVRTQGLVDEGWRAYLAAEPGFAEARLAEARLRLIDDADLEGAVDLIADATFRIGAVRLFGGRTSEAAQAFALAARLDGTLAPSPREVSPDVIDAFHRAQLVPASARHPLALRVTVEVGEVSAASVSIDGGPFVSPTGRVELGAGEHLLVARAPGHHAAARLVRIPGVETSVELALERDASLALIDLAARVGLGDGGSARATLGAAIVFAELDEVVLVGATFRGGDPTLRAQRCAGSPARCGRVAEVRYADGGLRAAVALLVTRLVAPGFALGELDAIEGLGGRPAAGGTTSAWRKPWPWLALGAAAVLVTVLALSDGDAADPRVRVCVIDAACP